VARLVHEGLPPTVVRSLTRRNMVGRCRYAAALGRAFLWPAASLAICGAVALFCAHPGRMPLDATALPAIQEGG
jgi:hypothetical protein